MEDEYLKKKSEFHKKYIKTKEFEDVRNAVFKRDGYKCVICQRGDNLVCHHTSYKHLGQHNQSEIDDCITLCQLDHLNHHKGKYNIHWYSVSHPRNNDTLREVEYWGLKILVSPTGTDFYDAETLKKLKIHRNKKRSNRETITLREKQIYTHRLVAKAFPEICGEWFDDCEVHHIDYNVNNNMADNLMIVSQEEHDNIHKNDFKTGIYHPYEKTIIQYSMSGNYIATWESTIKASESTGICRSAISNVLCGISESAGGYIWKKYEGEIPLWVEPLKTPEERSSEKLKKTISQYTVDGEWIKDWDGLLEPTKVYGGKSKSAINNCLKGRSKTAFGYVWKYK